MDRTVCRHHNRPSECQKCLDEIPSFLRQNMDQQRIDQWAASIREGDLRRQITELTARAERPEKEAISDALSMGLIEDDLKQAREALAKANKGFEEYERRYYLEVNEREKAQEALAKAEAELTALRRALLKNWPDCILVDDDGQYESLLKEAGLIEPREVVEPCNKNECCCEPGDTCNFLTEKGRAALGGLNG